LTFRRPSLYGVGVLALGLLVGILASYKVLLEPGMVGLFHDWDIPPARGQVLAYAGQLFNGWQTRGLGAPLDYPADYPFWFGLALFTWAGFEPALTAKMLLIVVPALAFVSATTLARRLAIRPSAALLCGFGYAFSPVLLNKLISGQATYLIAYFLLPVVAVATISGLRGERPIRAGLLVGALLGLIAMQIQLGAVAALGVAGLAFFIGNVSTAVRVKLLAAAVATLLLIELPTIIALALNHAATANGRASGPADVLDWLKFNSVPPLDALKLDGYAPRYITLATGQWYGVWSAATYVIVAAAIIGFVGAPSRVRWSAALVGIGTLLLVTGVHSPIGSQLTWLFVHVPVVSVLRELYHFMAIPALICAVGLAYFWQSPQAGERGSPQRCALFCAAAVAVSPFLSGDAAGFIRAQPYDTEMRNAYQLVEGAQRRVLWLPMDQPLSFLGSGAGGDPMALTRPGSLWTYSLAWPLTALDIYARSSNWHRALQAMRALSVGWVVARPDFDSLLAVFLRGGSPRQYFLRTPLVVPRLSRAEVQVFPYARAYPVDGLPKAYRASVAAFVPPRLDIAGAAADRGLVPLDFDLRPPAGIRYVVVRDRGDAPGEMLAGLGTELSLPEQTNVPEKGFASLPGWWFFSPAYAEARSGIVTFGTHTERVPIDHPLRDSAIVVSWIGTPLGGRFRVRVAGRSVVVDTAASPVAWRSTLVPGGTIGAGESVVIEALDAPASVAIRSVYAVDGVTMRKAVRDFARLTGGAARVIFWEPVTHAPFRFERSGQLQAVGDLSNDREYRLDVSCRPVQGRYVWVLGSGEQAFGYARVDPRSGIARMEFPGIGDAMHLGGTCARRGWSLSSRPLSDPDRALALYEPRQAIAPGLFDGVRGRLSGAGDLGVLNVAYGSNWRIAGAQAHLKTSLGTNVWMLPSAHAGVDIENAQSTPFRLAFSIGLLTIVGGLASPLAGPWRRPT
jgi:hypothetical protein